MSKSEKEYLKEYVAIPSVNPMGRSDQPAEWVGEARLASHIGEQLRALGVDVKLVGAPDRPSVMGVVQCGQPGADTVMVASHLDTVPVDGMEIPAFDPAISGGRLSGRGSCDTKSGMAALMAALGRVLERGVLRRNLIVVGESDEELGSRGVEDVLGALGRNRPDWVLATEPTELRIAHKHKGVALIRLEATGRACHSSNPDEGRNALVSLSRAAVALDGLACRLAENPDPELGAGTLSVGQMGGGQAPNIVPDSGFLVADRRLLPGETADHVRSQVEEALSQAGLSDDVSLVACIMGKPALSTSSNHFSVHRCRQALMAAGLEAQTGVVAFGTDAGVFERSGLPGVVMGPGSIRQAHTSTEYVELDQVASMTDFFEVLLSSEGDG